MKRKRNTDMNGTSGKKSGSNGQVTATLRRRWAQSKERGCRGGLCTNGEREPCEG